MAKNFPWTSVVTLGILVVAVVVLSVVNGNSHGEIVTVLVGLIPGILAAGYAERTNRDVRNGVVQEKAKAGTLQALSETGVTDVVNIHSDLSRAYMQTLNTHTAALAKLLNASGVNVDDTKEGSPQNGQSV